MNDASFAACAATVRHSDPDRYFSALLAPTERRPFLLALYALNCELARISDIVREPMLGEIRLQWWREALSTARAEKPRRHHVVEAMTEVFRTVELPQALFEQMIDARAFDASGDDFATYEDLENYLDATSGTLIRIAARILGGGENLDQIARDAGIAYGLAGTARSLAFYARRGKNFVPTAVLNARGISRGGVLDNRAALAAIAREFAARAAERFDGARVRAGVPLAAFLPAALVPLFVRQIMHASFDPLDPDVGLHRRLVVLLLAAVKGRI